MAYLRFTILALILHSSAARPSFLRMHTNDANEVLQGNLLTSLVSKFSDESSANAITVKLLEGISDDDENWTYVVLETLERLKQQVQENHEQAQRDVNKAEQQIQNCTDVMNAAGGTIQEMNSTCNGHIREHTKCRNDQDASLTKWNTTYTNLIKDQSNKTQKCHQLQETLKTYSDKRAVLKPLNWKLDGSWWHRYESGSVWSSEWSEEDATVEYTDFCVGWGDAFQFHKDGCNVAISNFEQGVVNWNSAQTTYIESQMTCDNKQKSMDTTCCAYSLKTSDVCRVLDGCRQNGEQHRNDSHARVQREETQRQFEWEVYEKIECLLEMLQNGQAVDIDSNQCEVNSSHLEISYPAIPECPECKVDDAWPGTTEYTEKTKLDVESTNYTHSSTSWGSGSERPDDRIHVSTTGQCTGMYENNVTR